MPTPVDRALQSRNLFFGFAGLVALASVWNMFSGETFPADGRDPDGDPEIWSEAELRQWLRKRDKYEPNSKLTREQLIEKVKTKMSISTQLK